MYANTNAAPVSAAIDAISSVDRTALSRSAATAARSTRPAVIVALGASAARSLLGTTTAIAANREMTLEVDGRPLVVTYHPSAVLRSDAKAEEVRQAIADDLSRAARLAGIR